MTQRLADQFDESCCSLIPPFYCSMSKFFRCLFEDMATPKINDQEMPPRNRKKRTTINKNEATSRAKAKSHPIICGM